MAILAGALTLVNACASVQRPAPAMQERSWREYLGSPSRANGAREPLGADPQPVWRTDVGRGIIGAPALGEDVIAVALVDRQVALLDRATGELLWRRRLGQHAGAGPLLADDRLFVATQDDRGRLVALRLADGKPLWTGATGDVAAPLVVAGELVFAGALDGWVSAWETSRGERRWRTRLPGAVRAAPAATPPGLVVATTADSLFLLDRHDGRILARRATRGTVLAAPALADSLLLVGTAAGRLEALDPGSLQARWSLDLDGGVVGHVAARAGHAYALTTRGTVHVVPLAQPGSVRRMHAGLVSRAGPTPTVDGVLVCGVSGEVVLLDGEGRRRWAARLDAAVIEPALVEGRTIITVSQRGEVVVFR